MIVFSKRMKQPVFKYFSLILFLLLFTLKGLVSILPLFPDFSRINDRQEIRINSQSENNEENTNEKQVEIKEFFGHFYNDHSYSLKYAFVTKTTPITYSQIETNVFLPVNTPPPKQIL
jgi:hypothetical protein